MWKSYELYREHRLHPMMHFRQRLAWLLVMFYLAASGGVVYYIFEISEQFNAYALDHVERYHGENPESEHSVFGFLCHITDIPLTVWLIILIFPYLQVFCMLIACTKPEPRLTLAYLWPFYLYLRCKQLSMAIRGQQVPKAVNMPLQNGHIIIDT